MIHCYYVTDNKPFEAVQVICDQVNPEVDICPYWFEKAIKEDYTISEDYCNDLFKCGYRVVTPVGEIYAYKGDYIAYINKKLYVFDSETFEYMFHE